MKTILVMEKELTVTAGFSCRKKMGEMLKKVSDALDTPFRMLGKYYSDVLERDISLCQAKALTEAQAAFLAAVMPADYNLLLRTLACAWFVIALRKCRRLL